MLHLFPSAYENFFFPIVRAVSVKLFSVKGTFLNHFFFTEHKIDFLKFHKTFKFIAEFITHSLHQCHFAFPTSKSIQSKISITILKVQIRNI